ncbi:ranaspumin-like [Ranitomeya variabilis]|uniref:ranaspumin-like n=1 Tax=Ranitomeya variabilis TaxID=490064 RepID=UPI004055E230
MMRIAVVFLVLAVSSCSDALGVVGVGGILGDLGGIGDLPNPVDLLNLCLIKALTNSQLLLLRLAIIICKNDILLQELNNEQIDNLNDENWKALYQELEEVLEETTCTVSDILGIDALENLAEPVAITLSKILEILRPILEKSGLDKPAFSALCGLTKKLLAPECLPYIVGADIPKLVIDLKTQACPGHNKDIVLEDLKNIVKRVFCLVTDRPLSDSDLDDVVRSITQDTIGLVTVNGAAKPIVNIIVDVLCSLVNLILPTV